MKGTQYKSTMARPLRNSARIGQVFQPRDRRLRTQFALRSREIVSQLEDGIAPKRMGVGAVLVPRRDHQQPKADDVGDRSGDLVRRARIGDASRHASHHAIGHAKALLDLTQHQNPALPGKQTAVELRNNFHAPNR